MRKRGGRKRALGTRAAMTIPQGANQRWSVDFASDTLSDSRRFRVFCVIDDFTRECLATIVDNSITGERVARELDNIAQRRGFPLLVVSDNGTEFTSNVILRWQQDQRVEWHYIAPGKPDVTPLNVLTWRLVVGPGGEDTCAGADSARNIIGILKELQAGRVVAELCRKYGIKRCRGRYPNRRRSAANSRSLCRIAPSSGRVDRYR